MTRDELSTILTAANEALVKGTTVYYECNPYKLTKIIKWYKGEIKYSVELLDMTTQNCTVVVGIEKIEFERK